MSLPIVVVDELTKAYGSFAALRACSMSIAPGEVFGLLGPNGAGKTTLLRMLLGFLRPTAGRATVAGFDSYRQSLQVHQRVAYLPGDVRLFRHMTAIRLLNFLADMRPDGDRCRSRVYAERLQLDLRRRIAFMSTGTRQKVALAATLASHAPLVILDEPTSNLDPTVRREVTAMIDEARQDGRTILLSSHVMSEVEDACDRVAILRGGQLVHLQNLSELRRQHRIRAALAGTIPAIPDALESHVTVRPCDEPGYLIIDVQDDLSSVLGWISTLALQEVRVEPYGLQSVYDRFHPPTHVPRGTARSTISAAATT